MITLGIACIVLSVVIGILLGDPSPNVHNSWENLSSILFAFGAVSFIGKVAYLAFMYLP